MQQTSSKPRMYLWKGWIRFDPNPLTKHLPWISKSTRDKKGRFYHYFLPNAITRIKFATDILPHMNNFEYRKEDLLYLRNFKLVPILPQHLKPSMPTLPGVTWFDHQVEALDFALERDIAAIYLGTGTGKTLVACGLLSTLPLNKTALVLTPKKVIPEFKEEVNKYIENPSRIVVTNYEKLIASDATSLLRDWDMVIMDEAQKVKSFTSLITHNLKIISESAKRRYLFTGTPQDKVRSEIFSQLSVLDSKFMPTKTDFIDRYFYKDDYRSPTSEKLPEELDNMISEVCFGYRTDDVLDLPDEVHRVLGYAAPPIYWELASKRIASDVNGNKFIADTPASLRLKLRQMCSGFCTDVNGDAVTVIPSSNTKIGLLRRLMQAKVSSTQCVIFTEFKWEQQRISAMLKALQISFALVNGTISNKQCSNAIDHFKKREIEILVVQSRCGGAGLNLQNCHHTIFFSLPESSIVFEQCKGRTRRAGQKKICYYYYLIGNGTIEQTEMLDNLRIKETNRSDLFNLFEGGNTVGN